MPAFPLSHTARHAVRPGRHLAVSQTYGDDSTAARNTTDISRPWQTLAAALSAASSGDTIHVLDGAFTTEPTLTLKDGVHWEFSAGASFTGTFSDASSSPANPSCAISALGDGLSIATLTKSGSGTVTLVTPTKNNRDITYTGNVSLGTLTTTGNIALGPSGALIFEGATADAYETTLTVVDPTADRTVTLPNADVTLVGGTYTAAASGDASGLTSGTLPTERLSSDVVKCTTITNPIIRTAIVTWDIPNMQGTSGQSLSVTVPGVTTSGNPTVIITPSAPTEIYWFIIRGVVTSADTVTIYVYNTATADINAASMTFTVAVLSSN